MFFRKKKASGGITDPAELARLCSKPVRYVTLRDSAENTEIVIGKSGYLNFSEGRIMISCENGVVFNRPVDQLSAGELLSKNGATFSYTDEETGKRMTVVAHYVYYRK